MNESMVITKPLVVMFDNGDGVQCDLWPPKDWTHHHYGLSVCDFVRHVAAAFKVDEDDVWEWVDKERHHHTTDIRRPA